MRLAASTTTARLDPRAHGNNRAIGVQTSYRRGMRRGVVLAVLVVVLGGWGLDSLVRPPIARACGGFFSAKLREKERRPSLAYEQSLIVFDAAAHRQHFIREVVFRTSATSFGFVVPTPTRPEVAKVQKSPFASLRAEMPFQMFSKGIGAVGSGTGQGFGSGKPRGVTVLDVKKIGSFTAFVLAADDDAALRAWLDEHHFASTPEADRWLAHYVKMKFFYVAMRYDPPATVDYGRTTSETVRISFDTELAYYPYYEPDPPNGVVSEDPRMLELWLVSDAATVPVAAQAKDGEHVWVRPFAEGIAYPNASRKVLEEALGSDASLLPKGELLVQRFMDQKRSRVGFGDVVFVPAERRPLRAAMAGSLVRVLDPGLIEGGEP